MSTETSPWPVMSWPSTDLALSRTVTHACAADSETSSCGVATPFRGATWPLRDQEWPAARTRCSACAHAVYGHDRA